MAEKPIISYSPALFEDICSQLAEGTSLKRIIQSDVTKYPARSTFYNWLDDKKAEDSQWRMDVYARARLDAAEAGWDEIDEVIEAIKNKKLDPNSGRVIIDAHKWRLCKLNNRKYGEKLSIEQSGTMTVLSCAKPNKPENAGT